MSIIDPKPPLSSHHSFAGIAKWRSPSNIALIKYWGKKPVQIPANASISFTLNEAFSETQIKYQHRASDDRWVRFLFEGQEEPRFEQRISSYLESLLTVMPFLDQLSFEIESLNSFPHSSGIASSASSMSALALCLCDLEKEIYNEEVPTNKFRQKASYISRLGSGSASRSLFSNLAVWGKSEHVANSSDEYAIAYTEVDSVFNTFHDDVLIVSEEKKSVSSSQGHALMDNNIFASSRYKQADQNMEVLLEAMKVGDLMSFGKIIEDEALTLHALMMCSDPSFILMKPKTLSVIEEVRKFRLDKKIPIFFTLDAGPNVHILYPHFIKDDVVEFINSNLKSFAENGRIIPDHVGEGPIKLI